MRKSDSRLWRAVLRVVALVVVLSAVPIALVWLVGNPLPESIPNPRAIELAVRQRNVPGEVVVKTLSVLLWVVWGQLAWSTLWELLFAGPRRSKGRRTSGAPLVSRWMNRIVGRVVSGLFAAGVVIGSANLSASIEPEPVASMAPMAVIGNSSERAAVAADPVPNMRGATTTILVEPGDSLWSLAKGDVAVSRQILKMNPTLDSALDVVSGLELVLPELSEPDPTGTPQWQPQVEVEPGDNLWGVARRQLENGHRSPNVVELSEYVDELIVRNPHLADNPDLIFPGDLLMLPEEEIRQPTIGGTPLGVSGGLALPESRDALPKGPPGGDQTNEHPAPPQPERMPDSEPAAIRSASPAAYLAGTGSMLLCSGFVGLLRRRRRYLLAHRRPGMVPSDPPAPLQDVERLLRSTHQPDLAQWLTAALESLAARPSWPDERAVAPVIAELDDEQLVVTFIEPDLLGAPLPWTTKDGGRTWRLLRSWPVVDLPTPRATHPFPNFVTIGEQLMLNLEAIGALSVSGSQAQSEELVRSMVTEIITSPMGEPARVWATSAVAHLVTSGSVLIDGGSTLVEEVLATVHDAREELTAAQAYDLHHYRLAGGQHPIKPAMLFCSSSEVVELDSLLQKARQRSTPLIVVVLGEQAQTDWVLRCSGGMVAIEPMGVSVEGNALSASIAAGLEALLENSDPDGAGDRLVPLPEVEACEVGERASDPDLSAPPELQRSPASSNGAASSSEGGARPSLGIRLLGPIEVTGIEGTLTPQQLSLVSFLACAESATRGEISEALWDGRAMSPGRFPNLLAEVRNRIGRDHLPDADGGQYRLAHIEIDLQNFERLRRTPEVQPGSGDYSNLVEALELVRGVPLSAPGGRYWHWVGDSAHLAARLESQVADTAMRLARAAQKADDINLAQWAVQQGLLAAPLDETLVTFLAALYVRLGKSRAAKRLVENWEASIIRLDCGPPSDRPRLSLSEPK